MKGRCLLYISILLFLITSFQSVQAQLGFDLDIKKPEPYENRELRSEKTSDKKLKFHKRLLQNTVTHYNYFFNANNKLNAVIERAKAAHKDDYATLLSFYNYSLDATAQDKQELDSVIYKSKTGIVLHDLRNDWIDDLYLLWGAAYYLQQQYDSAYQMFQFINYAFADKEADGYYKYIGSRMDGNQATSIATKENESLLKRITSDPPGRNNALVWQVRTLIQSGAMPEAGSLIATLKNDPVFPARLRNALEEVQAYWYYRQSRWDSAATHLALALDNAGSRQERARWEYLIGQLYEKAGLYENAAEFYNESISHTTDPVMDIYARLNLIRINKEGGDNYVELNINELLKMARRERYLDYRDVIYYMAAQMELTRNNYARAQEYFLKSAQYKNGNLSTASQSYLQLAELNYQQKNYLQAAAFYDSVQIENLPTEEAQHLAERKGVLGRVVALTGVVQRQDSLQRVAAMPEAERDDYIKKLVRQLRRKQGLKEEDAPLTSTAARPVTESNAFSTNSKGEWYFYNESSKKQGAVAFQQAWGKRPNADNWRRASGAVAQLNNTLLNDTRGYPVTGVPDPDAGLSYEGLLASLPLTEAQVQASRDSTMNALYMLGRTYLNEIEDYEAAIRVYEDLLQRFPAHAQKDEILFHLHYCYTKLGNATKAAALKNELTTQHAGSRHTTIINTGKDPSGTQPSAEVTRVYEGIYDMYIEGRFAEAKSAKQQADSQYHTTYWQPQLLYIEAVYHIKQREDSTAKTVLNTLIQQNNGTPIADKATTLLNVLNRRQQIEQELMNLQIERPAEEETKPAEKLLVKAEEKKAEELPVVKTEATPPVVKEEEPPAVLVNRSQRVGTDPSLNQSKGVAVSTTTPMAARDNIAITQAPPKVSSAYTYQPETKHYAVVVLDKVDVVFGNEAKNAFARYHREKYYNIPLQINLLQLDDSTKLLLIGDFVNIQNAVDYLQKAKPIAATEIVPWLKKEKYTFTLISEDNLQVLQEKADLNQYQKFLDQNLPVKF